MSSAETLVGCKGALRELHCPVIKCPTEDLTVVGDSGQMLFTQNNELVIGNVTTDPTLGGSIELANIGTAGAATDIVMSPWYARNGGPTVVLRGRDNGNGSGELDFMFAPRFGPEDGAESCHVLDHDGLALGSGGVRASAMLDVKGNAKVSGTLEVQSIRFQKDNVRLIPMSFQVAVTSNAENVISLGPAMADYGITSLAQFRGLQYWMVDSVTSEVNKSEYNDSVLMRWKIQLDGGVPRLYIQHRAPNVNTLITVQMWWALP